MQWIHDPNQSNVDNLNNVGCDARRHFRKKKKAYLKAKFEELETNSKIQNIRDFYGGINDFNPLNTKLNPICHLLALLEAHHFLQLSRIRVKKGYQPRTNIVKDDKGDLVADSHSILARLGNSFSHIYIYFGLMILTDP